MPREPQQPETGPRVLLLEDDAGVRRSLHLLLRAHGFDVRSYAAPGPLLADLAVGDAQFLVSDYQLDQTSGIEVLRALRTAGWMRRAILITAFPSADLHKAAKAAGYDAVLEKPLEPHVLIGLLGGSFDMG
jgi:FixJ family two-component response regulator